MNTITSSIFLILMLLVFLTIISLTSTMKCINFPNYVTSYIKYEFFISLIPLSSFLTLMQNL